MARASKNVKLDDCEREAIVYGLRVKDVSELMSKWKELFKEKINEDKEKKEDVLSLDGVADLLSFVLRRSTNLTVDEFDEVSFADLDKLEAAFREVNEPFLRRSSQAKKLAEYLGGKRMKDALVNLVISVMEEKAREKARLKPETIQPGPPEELSPEKLNRIALEARRA